jgi:hypothetical protein
VPVYQKLRPEWKTVKKKSPAFVHLSGFSRTVASISACPARFDLHTTISPLEQQGERRNELGDRRKCRMLSYFLLSPHSYLLSPHPHN